MTKPETFMAGVLNLFLIAYNQFLAMTKPKRFVSWTGIDPSHIDLQHLSNHRTTTRATGESGYFSLIANPFHQVYN